MPAALPCPVRLLSSQQRSAMRLCAPAGSTPRAWAPPSLCTARWGCNFFCFRWRPALCCGGARPLSCAGRMPPLPATFATRPPSPPHPCAIRQACLKSTTKPKCSFEGGGLPPAKLVQLNIRELMGGDWRVRQEGIPPLILAASLATCLLLPQCIWAAAAGNRTWFAPDPTSLPCPTAPAPAGLQRRRRIDGLRDVAAARARILPAGGQVFDGAAQARRQLLQHRWAGRPAAAAARCRRELRGGAVAPAAHLGTCQGIP